MGTKETSNLMQLGIFLSKCWVVIRRILIWGLLSLLILCACLIGNDRWIAWQTRDNIIYDINDVSHFQVGVVLGTSKYLGKILNVYYANRIDAAIKLYHQGKLSGFLLSGDNAHRSYNEPWTMKRDLLKSGIPDDKIYLDYAGFRTLDSIVRAKRIFAEDHFLIITQGFHCERALYIAQYHDINAKCLAVPGPVHHSGYTVRLREVLARAKAMFDLYIMDTQPKFLGPKHPIELRNSAVSAAAS